MKPSKFLNSALVALGSALGAIAALAISFAMAQVTIQWPNGAPSAGSVMFMTNTGGQMGYTNAGTSSQVLLGGAVPAFGAVPTGALATQAAFTTLSNNTSGTAAPTAVPTPLLYSASNFRNLLDNPRFDIYSRGTAAVSSINTTATYHADRWAGYANTGAASVTLTNITSGLPASYANAEQVQRANTNASLQPIFLVEEIPSKDVITAQGQTTCVSASLIAGANFSAASSQITVQVITGTGTDQGLASLLSATWTGQATTLNNTSQAITTSWARYTPAAWCFTMPSTATEAAVQFGFTPVGTAGANDWFQITGAQFEIAPTASVFEQRSLPIEQQKTQFYYQQINEVNGSFFGSGACTATNVDTVVVNLLEPMRVAPTATITAGGFQLVINGAAATGITGQGVGTSNTQNVVVTATTACTAGVTVMLKGSNTTGKITASADF